MRSEVLQAGPDRLALFAECLGWALLEAGSRKRGIRRLGVAVAGSFMRAMLPPKGDDVLIAEEAFDVNRIRADPDQGEQIVVTPFRPDRA